MSKKRTLIGKYLSEDLKEHIKDIYLDDIPIEKIDDPPFHDRKAYSKASIVKLAENIKEFGLVHPIVVRKKKDGRYERIVGFRRIEAHKILGKKTIKALVVDVPEDKALILMLSENLHREDLNEYDKVYSQVQYIQYKLGFNNIDETLKFIIKVNNYKLGNIKDLEDEYREKAVVLIETIEKITGKSFRNFIDRIRILTVDDIIKEAVIRNNWNYTIAIELQKLVNAGKKEALVDLIKEAEENDYGYSQIKHKVEEILHKPKTVSFSKFSRKLSKKYPKLPDEKRREVDRLIQEIQKIIEEI